MRRVCSAAIALAVIGGCATALAFGIGSCHTCARKGHSHESDTPWLALHSRVVLVPPLQGGWGGWCVVIGSDLGCGGTRVKDRPIRVEGWSGGFMSEGSSYTRGWAITAPEVAFVSVTDGPRFPTHRESALPDHLRAMAVELRLKSGQLQPGVQLPTPQLTPFNIVGGAIPQRPMRGVPLNVQLPVTLWHAPARAPRNAICQITAHKFHSLKTIGGSVMTTLITYPVSFGHPYISCASTQYRVGGTTLRGSVLLDDLHPGSYPAGLPGMRRVPGLRDIFSAPGAEGEMIARRISGAWLVVDGGGHGLAVRLQILRQLRAAIRL